MARQSLRIPSGPAPDKAYRGYIIARHPITGQIRVHKGGFHIGFFDSVKEAKELIDMITD